MTKTVEMPMSAESRWLVKTDGKLLKTHPFRVGSPNARVSRRFPYGCVKA
ncbi:MAG: hypothetical protein IIX80_05285 [Clostridia bacterium]|nr:hypothetical protein [Clostridia bacterium]